MASTRDLWVILRARDEASRVVRSFAGNVRDGARQMSSAAIGVSQAATIMAAGFGAAGIVGLAFLKNSIDIAVEYERQVRHTATQVDKFSGNLEELAEIGRRAARDIAVPFEQIQPALFDIFSSMEVNVRDAEILLRSFSKAAVAGQVDIQSVSRATIGLLNAFQRPASDVNKLLDIQFQLIQEGVGTYEEWNERIGLVTPSAVRAGQSIEVMMAALASATRMGLSAARAGTSVARAFDALSHPKTIQNLKNLGVNARDAAGRMRPLDQILKEFRTTLMKLPEKDRLGVIIDVFKGAGGTIEARRFLQNMLLVQGNIEMFQDILGEMKTDTGAFERAYSLMAEGVAAQTQLLSNRWTVLREALGRALLPTFIKIVTVVSEWIERFNELSPSTKALVGRIIAIASVGAILLGVLFGIIAVIAAVAAAFMVAGTAIVATIGGFTALLAVLAGGVVFFKKLWEESSRFRQLLVSIKDAAIELWKNVLMPFFIQVGKAWTEHMQKPLNDLWNVFTQRIIPVVISWVSIFRQQVIPALQEVGSKVSGFLAGGFRLVSDLIKNMLIPAIERATKFYFDHKTEIDKVVGFLIQLGKHLLIIGAFFVAVFGGTVAIVVIAALAGFINMIMFAVGAILQLVSWAKSLWGWLNNLAGSFRSLVGVIASFGSAIFNAITGARNTVMNFFANAHTWLINAGANIIRGLISGITSMIRPVTDAVGGIVQRIRDMVPGSPAKMGPLSGRGDTYFAGQEVVSRFAKGMTSNVRRVTDATTMLASSIVTPTSSFANTIQSNSTPVGDVQSGTARSNTQNFYITTQELDPQYHAAQLGWLVENRMS